MSITKAISLVLCALLAASCGGGAGGGVGGGGSAPQGPTPPPGPPPDTVGLDNRVDYSTYLGFGIGAAVAVDVLGNAYVGGTAFSERLAATSGAYQSTIAGLDDGFVAKLAPDGALIYLTFLGGNGVDDIWGIAVDATGHVVVAGDTNSTNFPLTNAIQLTRAGDRDAFVAKLSPDGSNLVFSTYLGGSGLDREAMVAVDAATDIYIAGQTFSDDFPVTPTGYQQSKKQGPDVFVTKIGSNGLLIYSTFLGGADTDGQGVDIAVDSAGAAYVMTQTLSTDFPTTLGVLQPTYGGGFADYAITKLSQDGSSLIYSTYLGGSDAEQPFGPSGIAVDDTGHAYVTGATNSVDFPTVNAYQAVKATFEDAIVAKLSPSGDQLVFSTYLGGPNPGTPDPQSCCLHRSHAIAVDANGSAVVVGHTTSPEFPAVNPLTAAHPSSIGDHEESAFVSKFSLDGSTLIFSSLIGGNDVDFGEAVAVGGNGEIFVTGTTFSTDYPVAGALQGCGNLCESPVITRISNP